jgi:hypothetical protein
MRNFGVYAHDIVIHGGHTLVQGANYAGHAFYTRRYSSKNKLQCEKNKVSGCDGSGYWKS